MAGSNFDNEIKSAMAPGTRDKNLSPPKPGQGVQAKPMAAKQHNPDAVAKPPQGQFTMQAPPHSNMAPGQQGLGQATDQMPAHMGSHQNGNPASDGLAQAHAQIVSALSNRDMLKGH